MSAHLFFQGALFGAHCDRVLLEVVKPFVQDALARGRIGSYFFVRYGELGSHVRLRVYAAPEVHASDVVPELERRVANAPCGLLSAPGAEPGAVTHPSRVSPLRWIAYEPETARYGGPHALRAAESLFRYSSDAAVELLQELPPDDRPARLARALLAMVTLFGSFTDDPKEVTTIAQMQRDRFTTLPWIQIGPDWRLRFDIMYQEQAVQLRDKIQSFWRAATRREDLPAPLDTYCAGAREVREALGALLNAGLLYTEGARRVQEWSKANRWLLPSFAHMMSNRLGVTPWEECYLLHVVGRALGGP